MMYLEFSEKHAVVRHAAVPVIMQIYSEPLQNFRLAGRGDYAGPKPARQSKSTPRAAREPISIRSLFGTSRAKARASRNDGTVPRDHAAADDDVPPRGIRRMPLLRQISRSELPLPESRVAQRQGLADDDWFVVRVAPTAASGRRRTMEGVGPNTVWTWNAVGQQAAHGALPRTRQSDGRALFCLNHLNLGVASREAQNDARALTNFGSGDPGRPRGSTCASR